MIRGDVGPNVANLLLAGPPDFLDVVEVLLDGCPVGEGFENLGDGGLGIGAEESKATMIFLDQDHSNHATCRTVGRQEGLAELGSRLVVDGARNLLPTAFLPGTLGQTDPVLAVLAGPAAVASPTRPQDGWQVAQGSILAESAHNDHASGQGTTQERQLGISP